MQTATKRLANGWEFFVEGQSVKLTRDGAMQMVGQIQEALEAEAFRPAASLEKDPFDVEPEIAPPNIGPLPTGPQSGLSEIDTPKIQLVESEDLF